MAMATRTRNQWMKKKSKDLKDRKLDKRIWKLTQKRIILDASRRKFHIIRVPNSNHLFFSKNIFFSFILFFYFICVSLLRFIFIFLFVLFFSFYSKWFFFFFGFSMLVFMVFALKKSSRNCRRNEGEKKWVDNKG